MRQLESTIEAMLSAKLHLASQIVGDLIYFISNRSGHFSLYSMSRDGGGSRRLIPAEIALPSPKLTQGQTFAVFPDLDQLVLMIDDHGDESNQPCHIPLEGGEPVPIWGDRFAGEQVLLFADRTTEKALLTTLPRERPEFVTYLADLRTRELRLVGSSRHGPFPIGHDDKLERLAVVDFYTAGDDVLYMWDGATGDRRLLAGVPMDERGDEPVPPTGFGSAHIRDDHLLVSTTLFDDAGGIGLVPLDGSEMVEVEVAGTVHEGAGELVDLTHLEADLYLVEYNIDGVSFGYEAVFDPSGPALNVERVLWGVGELSDGVVGHPFYARETGDWSLAFSTATSPVQIYTIEGRDVVPHTEEQISGIRREHLASGEDASYTSHDGTRVSARLYLPSEAAGHRPPFPVVYYVHGGPQSQERPDFTWFSMPLIQLFTLHGFAVFVPNVRGSTGYGISYMKQVDKDWGGKDRLDHVAAVENLRKDDRLDVNRMGVMGRSYGGYMTLMLLGLHPELWAAGVDMFGPYNLFTFLETIPESWKAYMHLALGHPEHDRDMLVDRSPRTHLGNLAAPLLVLQGANDPRVVVGESDALVAELRSQGKDVEYLVFDDEGHDMVRHENKVKAYAAIIEFFQRHLQPSVPED